MISYANVQQIKFLISHVPLETASSTQQLVNQLSLLTRYGKEQKRLRCDSVFGIRDCSSVW